MINEQAAGGRTPLYAVYVRRTDGSPAIRIGEGSLATLSPDGKWAAAVVLSSPPSIVLLPTGVGESRTLDRGNLVDYQAVTWFPDGRRVLLAGNEAGRRVRLWVQDIWEGKPTPVSAEGLRIAFSSRPISPDGNLVAAVDESERVGLHGVDGREDFRPLEGLEAGDVPIRWSADGRSFYVFRKGEQPAIVYRFHLADRRKERSAVLAPSDLAGMRPPTTVQTTPDGSLFLYTYSQTLSDLFLVSNLR
jgi:eukaryotic-like serine/threonine-protein kinase